MRARIRYICYAHLPANEAPFRCLTPKSLLLYYLRYSRNTNQKRSSSVLISYSPDSRDVKMMHGSLVDGVDKPAKHQSVTIVPATRSVVRGRRATAAHDIQVAMLYCERREISKYSLKSKWARNISQLTTISCRTAFHIQTLGSGVFKRIAKALSWIAARW